MSHFSVAVFSHHPEDVEGLLAPYYEQTEDEAYLGFEEACESMEDIRAIYAQEKQENERFDAFLRRWYGYEYSEERDACGYLCNPNAKWDWWEIGGRWHNALRLKRGEKCDQAQIRELDFSPDEEARAKARRFWEVCVEGRPLAEAENPDDFKPFYRREYGHVLQSRLRFSLLEGAPGRRGSPAGPSSRRTASGMRTDRWTGLPQTMRRRNPAIALRLRWRRRSSPTPICG